MLKNRGIAFKLIFFILTSSTAVLALILSYDYVMGRKYISEKIGENAKYLSEITVNKIEAVLQSAEEVPETFSYFLESGSYNEAELKAVLESIVGKSDRIYGSVVAFEPYAFNKDQKYFAPYYYKGKKGVKFKSLGRADYDYFDMDWYKGAKKRGLPEWSEPYYDKGGGNILMATYSVPFYRADGGERAFAGVVTADVSLDWLDKFVSSIKMGKSGYGFLISKKGNFITYPQKEAVVNKTIFDMARERENKRLEEIANEMTNGKSGHVPYRRLIDGASGWLVYSPLPSNGWSLGIDFPKEEMIADMANLDEMMIVLAFAGILLLSIVVFLVSKTITRPLRVLDSKTKDIAMGNLDFEPPPVASNDEVGRLANSFVYMRDSLKRHIQELAETTAAKEMMLSELKIARNIQMALVPKVISPFSGRREFDIYATLIPATEVGGDFYDFFFVGENRLCIVIGDVSGKGVPAALFMAVTKTLIKSLAKAGGSPESILQRVNRETYHSNKESVFVTVFCGIIDLKTGELIFSNGGHNPPIVIKESGKADYLDTFYGTAVGAVEKGVYKGERIVLEPGDEILLYTDGVTEAMSEVAEMFSEKRLLRSAFENRIASARGMVKSIFKDVEVFSRGTERSDDIAMLALIYMPDSAKKAAESPPGVVIDLKNDILELKRLADFAIQFGKDNGLSGEVVNDINLALEEVFTNVITYGFDSGAEHTIEINIGIKGSEVILKVADDGKPFNPLNAPEPDTKLPLKDRPVGGLGILLTKGSVDRMKYIREGGRNILTMKKYL